MIRRPLQTLTKTALALLVHTVLLHATACKEPSAQSATPASSAPPPTVPTSVQQTPSIVFLGDSLTAGLGLSEQEALPARIQSRLDAGGKRFGVVNAGRSGDTTAGGLSRLDWYLRDDVDLRALVIGLGSNDAIRGLPLDAMENNLRQIIRKTRARKPEAKIFLWELETFPNMGKEYAAAYREVFPRVAATEGAISIPFPLAEVAARPELNQPDGVHPNALGTEKMAERIWGALAAHL